MGDSATTLVDETFRGEIRSNVACLSAHTYACMLHDRRLPGTYSMHGAHARTPTPTPTRLRPCLVNDRAIPRPVARHPGIGQRASRHARCAARNRDRRPAPVGGAREALPGGAGVPAGGSQGAARAPQASELPAGLLMLHVQYMRTTCAPHVRSSGWRELQCSVQRTT